jgi:ATP-dependent Lon protease
VSEQKNNDSIIDFDTFYLNFLEKNNVSFEMFTSCQGKTKREWILIAKKEYAMQLQNHNDIQAQKEFEGLKSVDIIDVDYFNKVFENAEENADEYNKIDDKYFNVLKKYKKIAEPKFLKKFPEDIHERLTKLEEKYPHCKEILSLIDSQIYLQKMSGYLRLPNLIFTGEAGCGKTSLAFSIAQELNINHFSIDLGLYAEAFYLTGLELGYSDGAPGFILKSLSDSAYGNNIFLVDEADKVSQKTNRNSPLIPLFVLMEKDTAKKFTDVAFQLPVDSSYNSYILTSNTLLPTPLLTRAIVMNVPQPSKKQIIENISNSVWENLMAEEDWSHHFMPVLSLDVRKHIANSINIRNIKSKLTLAAANCAKRCKDYKKKRLNLELSDFKINDEKIKHRTIGFI